jgi:hypothetical protein
LEQNWRH